MSTKEKQEQLVEILRRWQHIENKSVAQAADIIDKSPNPAIRLIMEIIQRDSAFHFRVEQFIIDSIEKQAVTLTPDDLAQVWEAIEAHIEAERRVGDLVLDAEKALAGTRNVVQHFLISYLGQDEKKHDQLLDNLGAIKRGMYKSA
jgi:catalase